MNIAILADIHGNGIALRAVIEDMKNHDIDDVIFLGDIVCKGPEPKYVLNKLREIDPLVWVKGNTDEWFELVDEIWEPTNKNEKRLKGYIDYVYNNLSEEEISYVKKLSIKEITNLYGYSIMCIHGTPQEIDGRIEANSSKDELNKLFDGLDVDIILCGHTHESFIMNYNKKLLINPGSIGIRHDIAGAQYGILSVNEDIVSYKQRRIDYNYDEAIRIAEDSRFPNLTEYIDNTIAVNKS